MEPVNVDFGKAFSSALDVYKKNLGLMVIATLLSALCSCCFILMPALMVGLYGVALRLVDGDEKTPTAGDVFAGFSYFLPALITLIVGMLGILLCGVGQIVTMPIATLALIHMFDKQNKSPLGSFGEVFGRIKNGGWMLILWVFLANIIGSAGAALCYIGVLFTAPLGVLITAAVYRQAYPKA